MTGNEYQELLKRTMKFKNGTAEMHALHGIMGEIGVLHSLFHREYQGHDFDEDHAKKELGNLLWFITEYCIAMGWQLEDVMEMDIEKYRKDLEKFGKSYTLEELGL